jgi:hypothetical protein
MDTGKWKYMVSFMLGKFISCERVPSTHWAEGWAGPRSSTAIVEKQDYPTAVRNYISMCAHSAD